MTANQHVDLEAPVGWIIRKRADVPGSRSVLAAISGIDGSGKGYVASQLVRDLEARGVRAASINADGWLNLPDKRISRENPAEHFYHNVFRFDDMFSQLILPLKERRTLKVECDFAEETATQFRRHTYEFHDLDVIVLEGIYLLRSDLRRHYDISFWVDCSFDTALERALARGQEGLPQDETIHAYRTIYFPAQEIHFQRDEPKTRADHVIVNDPRGGSV